MRVPGWVRRLREDQKGNVLIIGAATLPMLLGAAGLAVDTIQLSLWKRQLQRAADSAAIAGAHALGQGASTDQAVANDLDEHIDYDIGKNESPALSETDVESGSFAAGTLSAQPCVVRAVSPCYDQAVRVGLASERRLPFMSLFTHSLNNIEARGTAAVTGSGDFCMLALHNGPTPGVIAGGNANLDLSCGIASNSRASGDAINIFGDATIKASPLTAVGGITPGKNSYAAQVLKPFSTPARDPYASVQDPPDPGLCTNSLNVGVHAETTLASGACFKNWDVKGHVKLTEGGVYYVKDGTLDIKGKVSGTNVTIVLYGNGSNMIQNGGGVLEVTAPIAGPYKGIALFRSRTALNDSNNPVKINGGAELKVTGAIYMPGTDVWIGGNADFNVNCLQLIGRIIEFKGGGKIANRCENTGTNAIQQPLVRLVS